MAKKKETKKEIREPRRRETEGIPDSAKLLRELYEQGMADLARREAAGEKVRP